jgi:DNA repair protein RadC
MLVHNPSGDSKSSREDIELMGEICKAADALGFSIHNRLVIGKGTPASGAWDCRRSEWHCYWRFVLGRV